MLRLITLAILPAAYLVTGCNRAPDAPAVRTVDGLLAEARYIDEGDSLPRIQYGDGSVTLNDRCMVRQVKLNRKLAPVFVNGLPIAFC